MDIKREHDALAILLRETDRVCQKHKVKYFLFYGALLGLIRNGDFIPWDDDVDICVLREDYDKLIAACRADLDDRFEVVEYPDMNGYFFDFVPRILIKDSKLRPETAEDRAFLNRQNRIALDIFIFDRAPDNWWLFWWQNLLLAVLHFWAIGHRPKLQFNKYTLPQKIVVAVMSAVGRFIPLKKIFQWHEKIATCHRNRQCRNYIVSNNFVYQLPIRHPAEQLQNVYRRQFRDFEVSIPDDWDNLLKLYYGDYMTPPPENERIPLHVTEYEVGDGFFQKES